MKLKLYTSKMNLNFKYKICLILILFFTTPLSVKSQRKGCFNGNCKNGKGEYIFDNDDHYIGNWKNRMKEGYGQMYYYDGGKYDGYWSQDKKNGEGVLSLANGDGYSGEWINDVFHGKGSFHDKNNYFNYYGEWVSGQKSGYGEAHTRHIYPTYTYKGYWRNDKKNGKGVITFSSGDIYEGDWSENNMEGYGVYTWNDNSKYVGYWKNNLFNGNGKLSLLNGDVYEGNFVNGEKSGYGILTKSNGEVFKGLWSNGKEHGLGTLYFSNGKEISGNWKNGIYENLNTVQRIQLISTSVNDQKIKKFLGLIRDGQNLVSYAKCQQGYGGSWFISDLNLGKSKYIALSNNKYTFEEKELSHLYNNNNQTKFNNLFYSHNLFKGKLTLLETSFKNGVIHERTQTYIDPFEQKIEGSIETYKIENTITGSGLILFSAYSSYTNKKQLFIGNIETNKLINVDLTKLDNKFNYSSSVNGYYKGLLQGEEVYSTWNIYNIFQFENLITVFISVSLPNSKGYALIAVQIDTLNNTQKLSSTDFNIGSSYTNYSNDIIMGGKIYYLNESGGCINLIGGDGSGSFDMSFKSMDNKIYKITHFDKNLYKIKTTYLYNYTYVSYIVEKGDFLIVGGFTKTKGYVGYPNPVISVIRKEDLSVVYTKYLANKNGMIDLIQTDDEYVYIAISGSFDDSYQNETQVKPMIIIDKLTKSGTFENDLFE